MKPLYVPARKLAYLTLGVVDKVFRKDFPLITIFCYHSISDKPWDFSITKREFKKQIEYLSSKLEFITLKDVALYLKGKKKIKKYSAVLTFDDGYKDILSVKKYLKGKGVKPTVFVLSHPKSAARHELDNDLEFLNKTEILKLYKDGWEVGCHTATHKDMDRLSLEQIDFEVKNSKKTLEKNLGIPIKYIAYPKGKYNEKIIEMAQKAKYVLGLSMDDNKISQDSNLLTIPRIGVDGTHSYAEFKVLNYPSLSLLRQLLKKFI